MGPTDRAAGQAPSSDGATRISQTITDFLLKIFRLLYVPQKSRRMHQNIENIHLETHFCTVIFCGGNPYHTRLFYMYSPSGPKKSDLIRPSCR